MGSTGTLPSTSFGEGGSREHDTETGLLGKLAVISFQNKEITELLFGAVSFSVCDAILSFSLS